MRRSNGALAGQLETEMRKGLDDAVSFFKLADIHNESLSRWRPAWNNLLADATNSSTADEVSRFRHVMQTGNFAPGSFEGTAARCTPSTDVFTTARTPMCRFADIAELSASDEVAQVAESHHGHLSPIGRR